LSEIEAGLIQGILSSVCADLNNASITEVEAGNRGWIHAPGPSGMTAEYILAK